jgi:hypothetical protein
MTRMMTPPNKPAGHSHSPGTNGVVPELSQRATDAKLVAGADDGHGDVWDEQPGDEEPPVAEDDPPLNEMRRFHLEPDDRGPLEFIGKLIATASVERQEGAVRTWMKLYETRAGKGIIQMKKYDGLYRNVGWQDGDVIETARVLDTVDAALASVRSAAHRRQLLSCLGRASVEFIE